MSVRLIRREEKYRYTKIYSSLNDKGIRICSLPVDICLDASLFLMLYQMGNGESVDSQILEAYKDEIFQLASRIPGHAEWENANGSVQKFCDLIESELPTEEHLRELGISDSAPILLNRLRYTFY